jgi:type VI secretion system protein ImpK
MMVNPYAAKEDLRLQLTTEPALEIPAKKGGVSDNLQPLKPSAQSKSSSQLLSPIRSPGHHSSAGLNPIADAAGYILSVLGKLKNAATCPDLSQLQAELMQEINAFNEAGKNQGYNAEYIIVCRYILCATIDEILCHTHWGKQGRWDACVLLAAYNQDIRHQEKFFAILEHTIKEPALYIDLMEVIYLCLSLGYKGQYRFMAHGHELLEQITHNLYKHIRAYRGSFSKTLSPTPLKAQSASVATAPRQPKTSPLFIFIVTACVIMAIFISLSYIMDVISNESYKNIKQAGNSTGYKAQKQ